MKKVIILISILVSILIFKPTPSYAWDDCVFGKVNDEYPGSCARYIDTDNDNICDHSQPAPEDRINKEVSDEDVSKETSNVVIDKNTKSDYYFDKISLILIPIYVLTFLLVKFNKMSIRLHRKIWNVCLTLSFTAMLFSGILLVLKVSYGINLDFISNMVFWHVETGIIFALIAVFHILWHLPYYKNILK